MSHSQALNTEALLKKIEQCQAGDASERNTLIQTYMPFIVKTTSEHLHRYIEVENNDELTIAMMAFNETINKYQSEKGNFISFAKRLIINRLIDYQRLDSKVTTLSYSDPDTHIRENLTSPEDIEKIVSGGMDLAHYETILNQFGLTYDDLINTSPKHSDTRKRGMTIGKNASKEPPIVEKLYLNKRLPITLISTTLKITVKIVKRSKSFITSVIIAYVEKVDTITDWIDEVLKG